MPRPMRFSWPSRGASGPAFITLTRIDDRHRRSACPTSSSGVSITSARRPSSSSATCGWNRSNSFLAHGGLSGRRRLRAFSPDSSAMRAASSRRRSRPASPSVVVRTRAIDMPSGLASTPIARRPSPMASTSTVPLPQNGSTTRSPALLHAVSAPRAIDGCIRPA